MCIAGIALVFTYVFQGGLSSLINIDISSTDGRYLGFVMGQLISAFIGIALLYYGVRMYRTRAVSI